MFIQVTRRRRWREAGGAREIPPSPTLS